MTERDTVIIEESARSVVEIDDGVDTRTAVIDSETISVVTALEQGPPGVDSVVDASPTVKGILKLTGDLSGTANAPTVPGLSLKPNKVDLPVNVKDYWATGNGTTDDTAAIQAAVNAAGVGGSVFVPKGTYIVDPNVSINLLAGQTFAGTGRGSVLKVKSGANVLNNIVKVESAEGVTIKDLAIDGNRGNLSANDAVSVNYGVYVADSPNCRVINVYAHHTTGVGIHVYGSPGTVVSGCDASNNRYHGFECEQDQSTVWKGNRGHHNDRHGIFVSPGEVGGSGSIGNTIVGNSFDHNGQYGVAFGIDAAGISIGLTRDNVLANNVVTGNAHYGISIYRVDDVVLQGNIIEDNGYFGVYLYRAERNQIIGNRFHKNSQAGNGAYDELMIEGAGDGQASKNNVISDNVFVIDGATKARWAINEATSGDGPNFYSNNVATLAGTLGKFNIQHASSTQMVDTKSDQTVGGKKVFTTGFGLAAGTEVPSSAEGGLDTVFNNVTRLLAKHSLQNVALEGSVDYYVSDGTTMNNVASFYNNRLSMHGFPIKEVTDPTENQDVATKAYVDRSADKNFTQSFAPTTSVTVTHNLGKRPSVTVIDSAGDECVGDVHYISDNQLTVSFSNPFGGVLYLN